METLLTQYNPHWQNNRPYQLIFRARYCREIMELAGRREITVLKGIRRSGKSSLLKLAVNELLQQGTPPENILFMNLEDYRLGGEKTLETLDQIYQAYRQMHAPEGRIYLLFDEIQEIPGFEKWLRTHYEQNEQLKFMITGSSSSLFSRELATLLTGRQVSLEIFPFSFREYLDYRDSAILADLNRQDIDALYLSPMFKRIEPLLRRYLDQGGFPEMLKNENGAGNILALQQYISDIILRDIAQRYNIRKIEVLQKLTLYLIFNMSNFINITRIAELVGSNRTTVLELLAYLKEVYMLFTAGSFSFSPAEQLNTTKAKKVFCVDNGFFAAINTDMKKDFAKKMRNLVFQHLRFQWGKELFYWKDKAEIDLVLPDGYPVQVAVNEGEIERAVSNLFYYLNQHNQPRGLLVSWNKLQILEENERTVVICPLWIFLSKDENEVRGYGSD